MGSSHSLVFVLKLKGVSRLGKTHLEGRIDIFYIELILYKGLNTEKDKMI